MQMKVTRACVSRVSNVTQNFAFPNCLVFGNSIRISRQVSVIKYELPGLVEAIKRCASKSAVEQSSHDSICGRDNGRRERRRYVDRFMPPALTPGIAETVPQLAAVHTRYRNLQPFAPQMFQVLAAHAARRLLIRP